MVYRVRYSRSRIQCLGRKVLCEATVRRSLGDEMRGNVYRLCTAKHATESLQSNAKEHAECKRPPSFFSTVNDLDLVTHQVND